MTIGRNRRAGCWWAGVVLCLAGVARAHAAAGSNGVDRAALLQTGRAALEDGFFDPARVAFEQALQGATNAADRAAGRVWLARALLGLQRYGEALQTLTNQTQPAAEQQPALLFWTARVLFAQDRLVEALSLWQDMVAQYPAHPLAGPALRLTALSALRLRQTERALEAFQRYQHDYPQAPEAAENLLDWAGALLTAGRPEEASQRLEQLIREHPETDIADRGRLQLAQLWRLRQQSSEAEQTLRRLTERAAALPAVRAEAWLALAQLYEAQTNLTAAVQALVQRASLSPDARVKTESDILRGKLLIRMNNVEEGLALLRKTMAGAPSPELAARARLDLADTLLNLQRPAEALEEYQHYSEAFSDTAGQGAALMGKGWCLEGLGRHAEAATAFAKAAEIFPQDRDKETALCKAADALFAGKQYQSALEKYRQLQQAYPRGALAAQALYQAGACLTRLGQPAEAGKLFRTLAEAPTGGVFATRGWLGLAQVGEELGQWDDAFAAYDRAMQATGTVWQAEAWNGRAMLHYRLGQFKTAQADFEGLIAQFPGRPLAEQAGYMRGWCLYLLGQDQAALAVCRQFVEQHPQSAWTPEVLFWLGEYYFNHADYPAAERQFAALATQYPQSPLADKALYWAGRATTAGKDYRRAIEYYSQLAKQYPDSPKLPQTRFDQGDVLVELNQYAGAILAFDEVITKFPKSYLTNLAYGRRGDCQFSLGNEDPARFADALSSYRVVLDSPVADRDLKWQAEMKMGRCLEKMGRKAEALVRYLNVVYGFLAERDKGYQGNPLWFTRAAYYAAALQENTGQWRAAVNIYRRVADAGVPASGDAWQRIQKIRLEHWVLF